MITEEQILVLAQMVHGANKAYCEATGDTSQFSWNEAPETIRSSAVAGVRAIVTNPSITPEDLHVSWMKERISDGWVYGTIKDVDKKTHPCLVPYNELPARERFKDSLFRSVVLTYLNFPKGLL